MRGALIGALIFEGLAADEAEAQARNWQQGKASRSAPCHDRHAVGPMAGRHLAVDVAVRTGRRGDRCSVVLLAERGPGQGAAVRRVLARGDHPAALDGRRARPGLAIAVKAAGPIDITAIIGQMVQMGDEGHNRNRAGTLMFLREILPSLIGSGLPPADIAEVARFVAGNDHFFLNLVMPTGKLMGDAAAGIPGSTVVTAMCRNGTDFGIRVSGTGDQWFTGPALYPNGLFLAGFGPDDANPDIGDSAIAETWGSAGW